MMFAMDDGNTIFFAALVLFLFIAILEGVLSLIGFGFSSFFDSMFPDLDIDTVELESDGRVPALSQLLGWINVGRVPMLMLLVVFLLLFGTVGLFLQYITGMFLGQLLMGVLTLLLSLYLLRYVSIGLSKVLPSDESSAVSKKSLVGQVATITIGEAKKEKPAEAKVKDVYNKTHYLMVEPENEHEVFVKGDKVLIIGQNGSRFKVVKAHT
jgi:membrane protein implicated in regulation of membrane protease activity